MIIRRKFLRQLLGGLFTATVVPAVAQAAGKSQRKPRVATSSLPPTPDSTGSGSDDAASKGATARMRLWKASDLSDQTMQIRFLLYGKSESSALAPLTLEADNYQFSNYVEVPSGPMVVEVSASGRATVLLPLHLVGGGRSTLLVRAQGADLSAEWIDDVPSSAEIGCDFSVYNLLPKSGDIQVELGSIINCHLPSTRSCLRLSGIKQTNYLAVINGIDADGKSFHWDVEADLRQVRKATLLIYPDAYGRIRPRITAA